MHVKTLQNQYNATTCDNMYTVSVQSSVDGIHRLSHTEMHSAISSNATYSTNRKTTSQWPHRKRNVSTLHTNLKPSSVSGDL